tara:strand:- start:344 stop:547 length:204 start_codon:yes stop_codon:yes gene_type:complete
MAKTRLQEVLGRTGDDQDSHGEKLREYLKLSSKVSLTPKEEKKKAAFKKNKNLKDYANGVRKAKYNG